MKSLIVLTEFGKELRKLRIEGNVRLKDLAAALGVTSSYLSSIEMGKKPLTLEIFNKIEVFVKELNLNTTQLRRLAYQQIKTINLENYAEEERSAIAVFMQLSKKKKLKLLKDRL